MANLTLPSILKIEYILSAELSLYPKKIIVPGDTISPLGNFVKLNLTEPASCNTTSERTPNGLIYTTKISGKCFDEANAHQQHDSQTNLYCYRLTDPYKKKYLVGTNKKPFPEIQFSPSNEASPSGQRVINFEITWVSTIPPIDIIDL